MKGFVESVLTRLNNLVVVVDAAGQVSYVSPSSERILGFSPQQLEGNGWWEKTIHDPEQRETIRRQVSAIARNRKVEEYSRTERAFVLPNGMERWIMWDAVPGPGNTVIGIGQDITERKQAEKELEARNVELQEITSSMMDSLEYARRIQEMILPDPVKLLRYVHDAFIYYRPRDIVSGDFYWFHKEGGKLYLAVADCTGHGVPGAMVSVLGSSVLRDVIRKYGVQEPSMVLEHLDVEMVMAMSRESGHSLKDGMDISLAVIDETDLVLEFAGAFRGLTHVRGNDLTELAGDRYPIGQYTEKKRFSTQCLQLQKGDRLYMYTDGLTDQFGGEYDKKFNRRRLKDLLLAVQNMPMTEQEGFIDYALNNWKQQTPQTDDMLLMGVEV